MSSRGIVFLGGGRNVIHQPDQRDVADAPQDDGALAVLRRFLGVRFVQHGASGALMAPKYLRNVAERLGLVELPGHDQQDVVGLIVLAVEGLQAVDRHAFDVGAVAHRGVAVVVPFIRGRHHALVQDAEGIVLAHSRTRCGRPAFPA